MVLASKDSSHLFAFEYYANFLIWVGRAIGMNATFGIVAQGCPGLVPWSGSVGLLSVHLIDWWVDCIKLKLYTLDYSLHRFLL